MPDMNGEYVLSKAKAKEFASLDDAKGRERTGMFVAEGRKCVETLIEGGFRARYLYADADSGIQQIGGCEAIAVKKCVLRQLTRLSTTPQVISFFELPSSAGPLAPAVASESLVLALDRIQDPGNLGTILRTCDWMGIRNIVAATGTADVYNPKVVQASMGAVASVKVHYTDLADWLSRLPEGTPVFGTYLDGRNIYTEGLSSAGVLVMGNEGKGISDDITPLVNRRLFIPPFGEQTPASESLNVATATAIALSQFRQRQFNG